MAIVESLFAFVKFSVLIPVLSQAPNNKKEFDSKLFHDTLTHFWSMFPLHTPWNHQKNLRFSGFFGGYVMGTLARNGSTYNKNCHETLENIFKAWQSGLKNTGSQVLEQ